MMPDTHTPPAPAQEYAYHLLRAALERFKSNPAGLGADELAQARQQADKTYELECLVLSSPDAAEVAIAEPQVDAAMDEVAGRYASRDDFLLDLAANGLDEDGMRRALHRELLFDAVMQKVGSRHAAVHDLDVRLFYEMHAERFEQPERRHARHILITVNPDFEENTPQAARARIEAAQAKIGGRTGRFASVARQFSECPTALEGGKLGKVVRGQLYPELDAELFAMRAGDISAVVETEVGLHLLWCERIEPGARVPLSKVWSKIVEVLTSRRQRNCQKAWLADLREQCDQRRRA